MNINKVDKEALRQEIVTYILKMREVIPNLVSDEQVKEIMKTPHQREMVGDFFVETLETIDADFSELLGIPPFARATAAASRILSEMLETEEVHD